MHVLLLEHIDGGVVANLQGVAVQINGPHQAVLLI